jgi:hypothetical protein
MELTKKIKELTSEFILFNVVKNKKVQEKIIELNRKQLLQGINSENITLASIKPYSESYAQFKGSNVVNLFESGDFYNSFYVVNKIGGFEIKANTTLYGYDFKDVYGDKILGLTDDSKKELEDFIKPYIKQFVYEYLQINNRTTT